MLPLRGLNVELTDVPSFHLEIWFRWQRSSLESSFVCQCRLKNKLNCWRLSGCLWEHGLDSSSRITLQRGKSLWNVCPEHVRFSSRSRKHTQRMLKLQDSLPEHRQSMRSKAARRSQCEGTCWGALQAPATASATVSAALKADAQGACPCLWLKAQAFNQHGPVTLKGGILSQKSQHPGGGGLPLQRMASSGHP